MNRKSPPINPHALSNPNTTGLLRLFVYGTLKRGGWNHDRFCRGFLSVEEAWVTGHLYQFPSGIPILEVPEEHILAHGTSDPLADVVTQDRLTHYLAQHPHLLPQDPPEGDWGRVSGEVFTFSDPETRLPAIDRLEGFHPGGHSLYCRVLTRDSLSINNHQPPAWMYVTGVSQISTYKLLRRSTWS